MTQICSTITVGAKPIIFTLPNTYLEALLEEWGLAHKTFCHAHGQVGRVEPCHPHPSFSINVTTACRDITPSHSLTWSFIYVHQHEKGERTWVLRIKAGKVFKCYLGQLRFWGAPDDLGKCTLSVDSQYKAPSDQVQCRCSLCKCLRLLLINLCKNAEKQFQHWSATLAFLQLALSSETHGFLLKIQLKLISSSSSELLKQHLQLQSLSWPQGSEQWARPPPGP